MKKLHLLPLLTAFVFTGFDTFADVKHAHQHYQKPGAAIRLAQPQSITLDPHSQKTVEISFNTPLTGELVLTHKPKPGITADASTNEWKFDLNSGQPKISLDVSSNEAGQYHIMFHAQISHAGQNSSRVFGIPVYVGDQSSPAIQKKHPEVISMKAQETVN